MVLISDTYRKLLQQQIRRQPSWGGSGHKFASSVARELERSEAESYLDYGCGKGTLTSALAANGALKGRECYEYDPGRGIAISPGFTKADVVTCMDVMEHVEEECVAEVLRDIASKTNKVAVFWIATGKAIHSLPNGKNAHITIHNPSWWVAQLDKVFNEVKVQHGNNYGVRIRCCDAR